MIFNIDNTPQDTPFPSANLAEADPNGLLAIGGDLSSERLLNAYRSGIFPWFSEGQPILWWSPDPRAVLFPQDLHISRSMRKFLHQHPYRITFDKAFTKVIQNCASIPRKEQNGTWIIEAMLPAYITLHHQGHAHSIEVWNKDKLVGGLYGIGLGAAFYGESMFSKERNTSKLALIELIGKLSSAGIEFIDCQVSSTHMASLGAIDIPRTEFLELNARAYQKECNQGWHL